MKLKTFKDSSMPQVLARVKREIGQDAVIVQTRTYNRGGVFGFGSRTVVEVTARKGQSGEPAGGGGGSVPQRLRRVYGNGSGRGVCETGDIGGRLQGARPMMRARRVATPSANASAVVPCETRIDEELKGEIGNIRTLVENLVKEQRQLHEPQMPEQLFDVYLTLIQQEVAEEAARELIATVQQQIGEQQASSTELILHKLVDIMDGMIDTAGPVCPSLDGKARVVALIGPTGVGKTTTIAKLAANFKLRQNKKVGMVTIDTYRIGAVEQLRTYAQIIDVPLKVVVTPSDLAESLENMRDMDVVLIDTAGRSQMDEIKLKELKTFLDVAKPQETHLVLSSTGHYSHMLRAADEFVKLGVDRLIITKLDEAVSFGVVLSVLRKVNASLSYVTTGQDVPDDIEVGSGRKLARMLLGLGEQCGARPVLSGNVERIIELGAKHGLTS